MTEIFFPEQREYMRSFLPERDMLAQEMRLFAEKNRIPILDDHSLAVLESLVVISHATRILELGTAIAYTTIALAKLLPESGSIVTIEKSEPNIELAEAFIKKSSVGSKITILKGEGKEILRAPMQLFDMVFLDADKEDYIDLYMLSLPLLRKGGIMVVDNLLWHGYSATKQVPQNYQVSVQHIRSFNDLFFRDERIRSVLIPTGDGLGVGIKL